MAWLREAELGEILKQHASSGDTEVGAIEARGAINFLALDDVPVGAEGEALDPGSVVSLPRDGDRPAFPSMDASADDPFLRRRCIRPVASGSWSRTRADPTRS